MIDAGFFPTDRNQVYELPKDDLFLTGTSEVALAGLHRGDLLEESSLPARYVGYSSCFRREAGTYGKDTSGIFGFTSLIRSKCSHSVARKSHGMNLKCSVK